MSVLDPDESEPGRHLAHLTNSASDSWSTATSGSSREPSPTSGNRGSPAGRDVEASRRRAGKVEVAVHVGKCGLLAELLKEAQQLKQQWGETHRQLTELAAKIVSMAPSRGWGWGRVGWGGECVARQCPGMACLAAGTIGKHGSGVRGLTVCSIAAHAQCLKHSGEVCASRRYMRKQTVYPSDLSSPQAYVPCLALRFCAGPCRCRNSSSSQQQGACAAAACSSSAHA